jgi:hypothetical protein
MSLLFRQLGGTALRVGLSLVAGFSLFLSSLGAQPDNENAVPDAAGLEPGERTKREQMILERFLSLNPDDLARIRQIIEKIEALSPEERKAMREKIRQYWRLDQPRREKMLEKWREKRREAGESGVGPPSSALRPAGELPRISPEARKKLQEFVDELSEDELRALVGILWREAAQRNISPPRIGPRHRGGPPPAGGSQR